MKTILDVLHEQGREGDTIGEALGGYLIAEALADSGESGNAASDAGNDTENNGESGNGAESDGE